jgi:hypothetical protein
MDGAIRHPSFSAFLMRAFGLTLLVLIGFGLTRWLGVPVGRVLDWMIGIACFWWLLVITTVPWNIHFDARAVLGAAADSVSHDIAVQPAQLAYARTWARRSLVGALGLHFGSALALYWIAASGISPVGYVGAAAALLLTVLRPALRGYEYISRRLAAMHSEVRYPRDDVLALKGRVDALREELDGLADRTNPAKADSWAAALESADNQARASITQLQTRLQELNAANQAEHRQLARDIEHAVAQLTTDGQVVEHLRELVRFWKSA